MSHTDWTIAVTYPIAERAAQSRYSGYDVLDINPLGPILEHTDVSFEEAMATAEDGDTEFWRD